MTLEEQAKHLHELDKGDFYEEVCKREDCNDFQLELDSHNNWIILCSNFRYGYCKKTAKSKLVTLEVAQKEITHLRGIMKANHKAIRELSAKYQKMEHRALGWQEKSMGQTLHLKAIRKLIEKIENEAKMRGGLLEIEEWQWRKYLEKLREQTK